MNDVEPAAAVRRCGSIAVGSISSHTRPPPRSRRASAPLRIRSPTSIRSASLSLPYFPRWRIAYLPAVGQPLPRCCVDHLKPPGQLQRNQRTRRDPMGNCLRRTLLMLLVACVGTAAAADVAEAQIWCPSCEPDVGCTVIDGAGLRWCANIEIFDFDFCVGGGSGYCTGDPLSALDGTVLPGSAGAGRDDLIYVLPTVDSGVATFAADKTGDKWQDGRLYARGCQNVIVARRYKEAVALEMRAVSDHITL